MLFTVGVHLAANGCTNITGNASVSQREDPPQSCSVMGWALAFEGL
jgi:hypothetical protein